MSDAVDSDRDHEDDGEPEWDPSVHRLPVWRCFATWAGSTPVLSGWRWQTCFWRRRWSGRGSHAGEARWPHSPAINAASSSTGSASRGSSATTRPLRSTTK